MKNIILLTILAFSNFAVARTAQEICGLDNARVKNAVDLASLLERTCPQLADFPVDSVQAAGNNILNIIQALEISQKNIYRDTQYQDALSNFENTLNAEISPVFSPVIRDRKGVMLDSLFREYSSVAQRVNNPEAYVRKLSSVLKESARGREAISCFNDVSDPRVSGLRIEISNVGDGNDRTLASYDTLPDPDQPGKYLKTINFNPQNMSPADALVTLAHEMKHACMSSQMINFLEEGTPKLNRLASMENYRTRLHSEYNHVHTTPQRRMVISQEASSLQTLIHAAKVDLSDIATRRNRYFALDEVKAYDLGADIFNEFAQYHPPSFCNGVGASSFFGGVLSKGQYASSVQADLSSGQFIHSLIETYSRGNGYDARSFYQTRRVGNKTQFLLDSNGKRVLDPVFESQYLELLRSFRR